MKPSDTIAAINYQRGVEDFYDFMTRKMHEAHGAEALLGMVETLKEFNRLPGHPLHGALS